MVKVPSRVSSVAPGSGGGEPSRTVSRTSPFIAGRDARLAVSTAPVHCSLLESVTHRKKVIMRCMWAREIAVCLVVFTAGTVCAGGAGAQEVPTERSVPPPIAEWTRGFTLITSVRELERGRTLVADRGEQRLYLINSETGAIDELLGRGEGPGEYQAIGWLYPVAADQTILTDLARRWVLLRDSEPIRTYSGSTPLPRRFRARLDGVATNGTVLASVSGEYPGGSTGDTRVLELAHGLGAHDGLPRLDTIARVRGAGTLQLACVLASTRGEPACQFLETEDQAVLFPDGWIAVALHHPYRIDWRSPDGDWIRGEALEGSVALSEAEKCAAMSGWTEDAGSCDATAIGSYAWPETLPPFLTDSRMCQACKQLAAGIAPWLFPDPHGRLVVRRTPRLSRRENQYDIFDREGELVERLTLPLNEAIVGFGESSIYTIRMDEFDLQWLRRHPWPPAG